MAAPASVVNATTANVTINNYAAAPAPAEASSVATAVPVAAAAAAPKRRRANGTGGVLQVPHTGKWYGRYPDVSQRHGKRAKKLYTKCFDTAAEAEKALDALVASTEAKKAAKLHELAQQRDHTRDLPLFPSNAADAEPRTAYYGAKLYKERSAEVKEFVPERYVRGSAGPGKFRMNACCRHGIGALHACTKVVFGGGDRPNCIAHGGGPRCAVEGAHLPEIDEKGYAPLAEHVLTEKCVFNGFAKPEWAGTRCCMGCLKRLEPTHEAVRVLVHKEHLMVAGIVEELHARGRGDLVGRLVHDCAAGPSRRRADLALRPSPRFLLDNEIDEHQHKDRETSCERRKLAGHMADHGAPAFTEEEGKLWGPPHPSDEDLDALRGTARDTPAMERLRLARKRATQRVLRDYAAARRGLGEGEVLAPKLHVFRTNVDEFVAFDGTKVGALFHSTGDKALDAVMRLKPTKAFAPAIKRIVDRLIALCDAQADDAWFEARPELHVEYFRYDGCARDGTDPNGAVAAAHAALDPNAAHAPSPAATARMHAIKAAAVARKRKKATDVGPSVSTSAAVAALRWDSDVDW